MRLTVSTRELTRSRARSFQPAPSGSRTGVRLKSRDEKSSELQGVATASPLQPGATTLYTQVRSTGACAPVFHHPSVTLLNAASGHTVLLANSSSLYVKKRIPRL